MKPYIFGARNGIYIIDLQKTVALFDEVYRFVVDTWLAGETVLFVGTKKQAQDPLQRKLNDAICFTCATGGWEAH